MRNKSVVRLWIAILTIVVVLIILNVNFGFQEKLLRTELIEHTAIIVGGKNVCRCLNCGSTGLAYCLHCGTPMNWNKLNKYFSCPSCGRSGQPLCPNCNMAMVGSQKNIGGGNTMSGSPIPIY